MKVQGPNKARLRGNDRRQLKNKMQTNRRRECVSSDQCMKKKKEEISISSHLVKSKHCLQKRIFDWANSYEKNQAKAPNHFIIFSLIHR
jgi:hypothetical protein